MKKLTCIIPDNLDPTILAGLVAVATDLRLESLNSDPLLERRTRNVYPGKSVPSVIMSHYTPEGTFLRSAVDKWATAEGYKSANSSVSRLVKTGYLRNLGNGRMQFVKPFTNGQLTP